MENRSQNLEPLFIFYASSEIFKRQGDGKQTKRFQVRSSAWANFLKTWLLNEVAEPSASASNPWLKITIEDSNTLAEVHNIIVKTQLRWVCWTSISDLRSTIIQQRVTKIITPSFVNLVTPKAGAERELLFYKLVCDAFVNKQNCPFWWYHWYHLRAKLL